MAQVGRISGPLLFPNLERNGIDLSFKNEQASTPVLYLDVNGKNIAVNNDTASADLSITGTLKSQGLVSSSTLLNGVDIDGNTISVGPGNMFLDAETAIVVSNLETDGYSISDNFIRTNDSNANIELVPNGTGQVQVINDLSVAGNIHTPGNITFDGNIVFGDELVEDTVTVNTDIDSDVVPDQTNSRDIGSFDRRWNNLYTGFVNGQTINTSSISTGGVDFNFRQGNILYVSVNGADDNKGDSLFSPFATIKRALEAADASSGGPVIVYVYPGEYQEELPLVIPSNVSVIGADIRNCIVVPDTNSQSEDVFHLNGETTVENITIKDFYYDDNQGYAFRFAPGAVISSRSPYIQNVSVITQGTSTSADDPRGFNSGDAGRGAYVDGAELDPSSIDASMLFHSVTFITPGVDGLTMTNGVRVEWLNSFTYFADRGLYAFNNSTGRVSNDGSTLKYGAELRSIGSANVYGNYGAVADGSDCLMYLINHNFAYVGNGKDVTNDAGLAVESQQSVESNSGRIYYSSIDHTGKFKVGENFFVDQATGDTVLDADDIVAAGLSRIVVETNGDVTVLESNEISTGNFVFNGNSISTTSGAINLQSFSGDIDITANTSIVDDLTIAGNFNFEGSLNLFGNAYTDTVRFNVDIDQNFQPNITNVYNLGSPTSRWNTIDISKINSSVNIYDNVIETIDSNSDLELRASGTGKVILDNFEASNNAEILGSTLLQNLFYNNVAQTGNTARSGNSSIVGNVNITGKLSNNRKIQFENILIKNNIISTTESNTDLEFRASGTGKIIIDSAVSVTNNLTAKTVNSNNRITVNKNVSADTANIGNSYTLAGNKVTSVNSNQNIELKANGTGIVQLHSNVNVSNNVTVNGNTNLLDTTIDGELAYTGAINLQNITSTTNLSLNNLTVNQRVLLEEILIDDNIISTTSSDTDLELRANDTGEIHLQQNTRFSQSLTVEKDITGNSLSSEISISSNKIYLENIQIFDNNIATSLSNSNLELTANGSGILAFLNNDVRIDNNYTVQGSSVLNNATITGNLTTSSGISSVDNFSVTGNASIDELNVLQDIEFEDIAVRENYITTTVSNSDLELRASGNGLVRISQLAATNDVEIQGTTTANAVNAIDIIQGNVLQTNNININGNLIQTYTTDTDLQLSASGTGIVLIPNNGVTISNNFTVSGITTLQDLSVNTLAVTGDIFQTGNVSVTDFAVTGNVTSTKQTQFEEILFDDNIITTTSSSANLELRANNTGEIQFSNGLEVDQNTSSNSIDGNALTASSVISAGRFFQDKIDIFDNVINSEYITFGEDTWNLSDISSDFLSFIGNTPYGFSFSSDGTKFFVISYNLSTLYEYQLSEPWNYGGGYRTLIQSFSVTSQGAFSPVGLFFKPDGTKVYVISSSTLRIYQYELSVPWDLSSITYINSTTPVTSQLPNGLYISPNGDKMFVMYPNLDRIYEFDLSTPWDISTNTLVNSFKINRSTFPRDVFFKPDGTKMIVIGDSSFSNQNRLHEFNLNTPWSISSAVFVQEFTLPDTSPSSIYIKPDGSQIYFTETKNDRIYSYNIGSLTTVKEEDYASTVAGLSGEITISSNTDIYLEATGNVDLEFVQSFDNTLSTDSMDLTIAHDELELSTNSALQLSAGGSAERLNNQADIRFNTDDEVLEAYSTANVTFGGVYSDDRQTSISAETTEFATLGLTDWTVWTDKKLLIDFSYTSQPNGTISANIYDYSQSIDQPTLLTSLTGSPAGVSGTQFFYPQYTKIIDNGNELELRILGRSRRLRFTFTGNYYVYDPGIARIIISEDGSATLSFLFRVYDANGHQSMNQGQRANGDLNWYLHNGPGPNYIITDDTLIADTYEHRSVQSLTQYFSNVATFDDFRTDGTDLDLIILRSNTDQVATVSTDSLILNGLQIDDVFANNNKITTNVSNSNLDLTPNGTGVVVLDDIKIFDNKIQNTSTGALTLSPTDNGSVKINSTGGVVVPSGATIAQPANPQTGDVRWNTSESLLEVFDGVSYISSAGTSTAITGEEYNDLLLEFTLIFG